MTQKVVNGFPQYFSYTYLAGKYFGTPLTQTGEEYTDVNLQSDLIGDSITVDHIEAPLLTIIRDGAFLHEDQGYEIIAANTIRIFPGLLENETVEFKKLVGASGVVEVIPTVPPVTATGYNQTITEATVYTDNSLSPVNAFAAIVLAGKTRISTQFPLNEGRVDVYINGTRSSKNDGVWVLADATTIEFNDNYSAVRMKVDIIKQKVG